MLQNLILTGVKETDNSIIEISLKLASIYAQQGRQELALTGYEWCIGVARQNIKGKKEDFSDKGECIIQLQQFLEEKKIF